MREIKFRAWDKELGKMIFQEDYIDGDNDDRSKWCGIVMDEYYSDEYEPMQYTGINDKNGKEIYEGDIVDYKHGFSLEKTGRKEITWGKPGLWSITFEALFGDGGVKEPVVTGNIHENPELLD